jgi:cell division protein FtsI (penicillin-binding protein 3)
VIAARRTRRRLALTVVILAVVLATFFVRMVDIQVVRAGELAEQGEARRSIPQTLLGARGDIVDRNGIVLADTVYRYDVTVSPRFVAPSTIVDQSSGDRITRTVGDALSQLGALTGQDPLELQSIIDAELAADPDDDFAYLIRGVETEVYQAVRELRIPWVYFERQPARAYPNGQVAGNLVGFLGTDGPQTGLELSADECLVATDGTSTYERGADGVRLPGTTVVSQEPIDGGTLELTIDSDVQWFAQQAIAEQGQAIGADWATAFVVRVADGAIIAAADWPTVDPNDVNGTDVNSLGARSFTAPYEPGSTIKALTFASLFDEGITTPGEKFTVPAGFATILNYTIGDAWAHGDLPLTSAGILMNSSNVGTSMIMQRVKPELRADMLTRFGLGQKTAVGFLGEESGRVKDPATIDGHGAYTQMFGQGMTVTSAQVASAYQAIANGGVHMPLTLVAGCRNSDGSVTMQPTGTGERILSEEAANTTVNILESVVTDGFLSSQLSIPGYRVAAKTGTAEVAENGRYGTGRIVSLAGIAPADNPQFVVVVTLARPDTIRTSAAAAPTFRSIMTQVLKTFRVPPSTQPGPSLPLTW